MWRAARSVKGHGYPTTPRRGNGEAVTVHAFRTWTGLSQCFTSLDRDLRSSSAAFTGVSFPATAAAVSSFGLTLVPHLHRRRNTSRCVSFSISFFVGLFRHRGIVVHWIVRRFRRDSIRASQMRRWTLKIASPPIDASSNFLNSIVTLYISISLYFLLLLLSLVLLILL